VASPPDPRPQRPGVSQIGEATTGNLARFYINGQIEDSGISSADLAIPDADLIGGDGTDFTSVTVGGGLDLTGGTLTATGVFSGSVASGGFIASSVGNALTAVGTNRATALALTASINNVTTAGSGTGVTLPSVATVGVGGSVIVFNAGANAIKVYGAGSDTIDGTPGATGVTLTNAKRCVYIAVAAATWISAQMGVVSA
jgi:hypothetical protein